MSYSPYVLLAIVAAVLVYLGVFDREKSPLLLDVGSNQQIKQPVDTGRSDWETKGDDQLPVTVTVTPIELAQDAERWKFQIIMDTHSGSLDDNLLGAATLADGKGGVYQPITWEGPGPGGHHREGTLIFNPVEPSPEYVELKIKDVGGIAERSFRWNLQ